MPLTLYESVIAGEQNAMEMDGVERASSLKFRQLSYAVETGEAEMISVDFVAKGGGNAAAVAETKEIREKPTEDKKAKGKDKGKGKAKDADADEALMNGTEETYLTAEDDERKIYKFVVEQDLALIIAQLSLLSQQSRTPSRCCILESASYVPIYRTYLRVT